MRELFNISRYLEKLSENTKALKKSRIYELSSTLFQPDNDGGYWFYGFTPKMDKKGNVVKNAVGNTVYNIPRDTELDALKEIRDLIKEEMGSETIDFNTFREWVKLRSDAKVRQKLERKRMGKYERDTDVYEKLEDAEREEKKREEESKPVEIKEETEEEEIAPPIKKGFGYKDVSSGQEKLFRERVEEYRGKWTRDEWLIFNDLKTKMKDWDSVVAAELVYIMKYQIVHGDYDLSSDNMIWKTGGKYSDVVYKHYSENVSGNAETNKYFKHLVKSNRLDKRYKNEVIKKNRKVSNIKWYKYTEKAGYSI